MLKFTKMTLAAALLASTASVAMAQGLDLDVGVGGDANAGAGGSGVSTGIDLDAGATIDLMTGGNAEAGANGAATVTIAANEDAAMAIDGINSKDQVKLIVRGNVVDDASYSGQIFADADLRGSAYHDEIQSEVEANATLVAALESHGFDSDDVMAVRSTTDGHVVLFVDDQA